MSEKRIFESISNAPKPPPPKRAPSATSISMDDAYQGSFQKKRDTSFKTRALESFHVPVRTNDEVHSTIFFCPVVKVLVDTPHFQRLRGLKQLGTAEYAYINCNHTRFEHSLGVAHLAERMCKHLQSNQPNLGCAAKDVLAVKIAGLLHDLGHSAFSHTFEKFATHELPLYLNNNPELKKLYDEFPPMDPEWTHEESSLQMIDAMLAFLGLQIDLQNLDEPLKQIGDGIDTRSLRVFEEGLSERAAVLTSRDFVFIKECINGGPIPALNKATKTNGFIGRPWVEKEWLYDIVSNRHSGLDVDKMDYFARDSRRATRASGEIEHRLIEGALVAWGSCTDPKKCFKCRDKGIPDKHLMIVYHQKMTPHLLKFFTTRRDLHEAIYSHHTTEAAGYMICDILCKADPYYRIPTKYDGIAAPPGKKKVATDSLPLSRCMLDESAYLRVKDSIIDQIANTTLPELGPARLLITRLFSREMYKRVADFELDMDDFTDQKIWKMSEDYIKTQMIQLKGRHADENGKFISLEFDDFMVKHRSIHCGRKDRNPLSNIRFLDSYQMGKLKNPIHALPEACERPEADYKRSLPREFQTNFIRVFCRNPEKVDLVSHVFQLFISWARDDLEMTADNPETEQTPQPTVLTQEDYMDGEYDEYFDEGEAATPRQKKLYFDLNGSVPKRTPPRVGHDALMISQADMTPITPSRTPRRRN